MNEAATLPRAALEPKAAGGLEVRSIAKAYDRRAVLHDVSLDVHRGEVVGLLGPNGAGKTTCFYSVMGLVKPDSGRIFLDGDDITELPMYRRAILGLGYLPQETSIFRGLTVEQNIMAVLEVAEPDGRARRDRLEQLLGEFGLTHLRESAAMALSGGERRRSPPESDMAADSLRWVSPNSPSNCSSRARLESLSGSDTSSTAMMFCSTVSPRKIDVSCGR